MGEHDLDEGPELLDRHLAAGRDFQLLDEAAVAYIEAAVLMNVINADDFETKVVGLL